MSFWKKLGKIAAIAAPIIAAPFTGGASLALIGAGAGAASAKLGGAGWKGTLAGAGLGAIPGLGKASALKGAAPSAGLVEKAMSTYGKVQPYMKGAQQVAGVLREQDQPRMPMRQMYPQMMMQRPMMNRDRLYGSSPIQSYYGRQQY